MRWTFCLLLMLGFGGVSYGQSNFQSRIAEARTSFENRLDQIAALADILEDPEIDRHQDTVGLVYYAIAYRYRLLEDHISVIDYSERAIASFRRSAFRGYQFTFSLSFLGESYNALNQDKESLDAYFSILNVEPEGRGLSAYGYAVNEIARKFIQYEDYESAIPVIDQFLLSRYKTQISTEDLIRILLSVSIAHSNLKGTGHQRNARKMLNEARTLYESLGETLNLEISIDMQDAALSLLFNESDASTKYSSLFEELKSSKYPQDVRDEGLTMLAFNASFAFQKAGNFQEALKMAKTAEAQFQNYGQRKYVEVEYLIYDNLASAYLGLLQVDSAHYYINKGIALFPEIENVIPEDRKFLLNLLYDQARIFYAQKDQDKSSLESALLSLIKLDQLLELHIAEQVSEYSINNLQNIGLKFYQLAIDVAFELNNHERFWFFSEKTKGLQLLKSHSQRRKGLQSDTKQPIIDSLKRAVVLLETKINHAPDTDIAELKNSLNTFRAKIIVLQREAMEAGQSVEPYELAMMIEILDRKELVLQYQYGSEDVYLQVVSNTGSLLKKVGNKDSINSSISNIRSAILDPNSNMQEVNSWSFKLYQCLIENNLSDRTELFIIPDRELYFLPFEILRPDVMESYLIEHYDISYLPSGSFRVSDEDRSDVEEIVAYKPVYEEGSKNTSPLPFIDEELASIESVFNVTLVDQSDTTGFLELLKRSHVLHFGGHAIVDAQNSEQSYLALNSEDRLRLGELYATGCISELVTLSACNTGFGGILDGEGVSSITRGFLFAGARSVVNTLWTVDDQSTSNIVGLMYKYLSQGYSKSHALRRAKLEYLQEAESYQRHPYYWAGIIGMGDMSQPIVYPTNWIKVTITIVIIVCITWFLTWRFNKKPMRKIVFLSDWEGLVNDQKKQ